MHTFDEVATRAAATAARLRSRGVSPESVVGLWATNDLQSVVSMFAIWRAGAAVQLVNTRLTPFEAASQLSEAGAHLVVGHDAPEVGVPRVDVETHGGPAVTTRGEVDPTRVAWIVFTSGSTGRPKGVRLTFGNLEASAAGSSAHLGHEPEERWLCDIPIFHVGGASILIRSVRESTTVLLEPHFDATRAAALLRAGDATLGSMVTVTLARVLEVHPGRYAGVRAVLVGGGPVPFDLVERARTAGLPALPTYGLTETASQVATARLSDGKVVAIPGAEIRTVADRIEVRGRMVSPGYIGEPERASDAWFKTGDLGVVHDDGSVDVLGRSDDVIVSGGENIHPSEVEAVIGEHPSVSGVVVIGEPDPVWGATAVAVYEGTAAPGELERHARYRLAGYKIPRRWVQVAELPRISIGKIDRRAAARMI